MNDCRQAVELSIQDSRQALDLSTQELQAICRTINIGLQVACKTIYIRLQVDFITIYIGHQMDQCGLQKTQQDHGPVLEAGLATGAVARGLSIEGGPGLSLWSWEEDVTYFQDQQPSALNFPSNNWTICTHITCWSSSSYLRNFTYLLLLF